MAKNIQITPGQLQAIIKEGVEKLHRETLIKKRIKRINEELSSMSGDKSVNELFGQMPKKHNNMEILKHYLEAAVWADGDEEWSSEKNSEDVDKSSVIKALEDVQLFMSKAGPLLGDMEDSQIGHDLWLTRNGHGAGFWDRDLGERGDALSEIAQAMGSKTLYMGEDGKIYID